MTRASGKSNIRYVILASLGGLVIGALGLYITMGCLPYDVLCMTDDGLFPCDPCDDEDVLCQELEERRAVDNWRALPGDVTVCPYTGYKFEVQRDSARVSYEGYSFVFSCEGECVEEVEGEPGKWLDDLVEEAGGPAPDPDPAEGGAIQD